MDKTNETVKERAQEKQPSEAPKKAAAAVFSKAQILASKKWAQHRDALSALLEDGKCYSAAAVESLLDKYYKRSVS